MTPDSLALNFFFNHFFYFNLSITGSFFVYFKEPSFLFFANCSVNTGLKIFSSSYLLIFYFSFSNMALILFFICG